MSVLSMVSENVIYSVSLENPDFNGIRFALDSLFLSI